jgi:RNA polymerase sigma factor (sigma-70 family)
MHQAPATRRSLIVKLRDPADHAAWQEFVTLYEPLVYRLARHKGLQDADANDLCQEVFRVVSQAIGGWDPGRGSFRGWLSRIARNLLINFLTRRPHQLRGSGATSVQNMLETQPVPDNSATAFFEAEYRKRLFQWVADQVKDEFTPATWAAFWQTAIDGHPPTDVAAGLGISVGAVYIARSRILARLRQRIEECGDAEILSEVNHASPNQAM